MDGFLQGKIPGKQRESHTEGHKRSGSPDLAPGLMRRHLGGYTAGIFPGFAAAPEQNNCKLHNTSEAFCRAQMDLGTQATL